MLKLLKQVITNNTGVSSKSFIMVSGMFLAAEVTQVMLVLTVWDYITTGSLNYTGVALLLGGLSSYTLASAWGKVKGEQHEFDSNNEEIQETPSLNKEDNII